MDLVVGASKFAANNLGSLLAQYTLQSRGVRDDIQYINDELASMQAFLNRLQRAATRDEQQEEWMTQVRWVANDIADYVDYVRLRLGGEPRGSGKLVYLRRKWYLLTTLYARHCIATDISSLKVRAQHVSERRTRYGVEIPVHDGLGGRPLARVRQRQAPPPPLRIGTVAPVGINYAMKYLKECFMRTNQQPRLLAIVGFGGLGKTTLAMALYRTFGDEFDCRASVLASQKFHLPTVLRSLINQFHDQQAAAPNSEINGVEEWELEALKSYLARLLENKRYHILIDDIWSVYAWESTRGFLPISKKGSTIVVTTRFKSVAEACRRQQGLVYDLKPLSDKNSYKLFCQIISSAPTIPSDGTIALLKKFGGLPLAIILVAGLVASKQRSESDSTQTDDHYLAQVDKDLGEELEKDLSTDGVTCIVNHCYNQLPSDLKTCLLYMSMFSRGCLISRKRLMRRWIAEGFIAEKHGKTVEEVAEDYFNELSIRNLIQAVSSSSNGKVKSYQVLDMVLEYIVVKSSYENFVTVVGSQWHKPFPGDDNFSIGAKVNVRWLSIQSIDQQEKITVERMKLLHVRSLTVLGAFRDLHSTLLKFPLLEVLDLEGCKDLSFNGLKKICKMRRLKYVSLRGTEIKMLPNMIGMLEYLQVLDIRDTNIVKLPSSVGSLQHMVHILAGNKKKRHALKLTEGITKMTALQTLSGVQICSDLATEVLRDLQKLTNLRKFTIYKVSCTTPSHFELLLSAIEHLSSCSLKYLAIDDDFTGFLDTALNASHAPPEHLHTLGLTGMLSQVPEWIVSLHNLEKLTLSLTSLTTDALLVLAELPKLFSLIFSLDSTRNNTTVLKILHDNTLKSGGKIFVPDGGFGNLKLLRFVAPVLPPLSFLKHAMPVLERIELRFRMVQGVYGLENLSSIGLVVLTVSSLAPKAAKEKALQVKESASMIYRNCNIVSVVHNEYNESTDQM